MGGSWGQKSFGMGLGGNGIGVGMEMDFASPSKAWEGRMGFHHVLEVSERIVEFCEERDE